MVNDGDEGARVRVVGGLVHRAVGGEVFVLMADSTVHWLRNPSAVALWEAILAAGDAGARPSDLVAALTADFDVDAETAANDVRAFVRDLGAKGVLDQLPDAARVKGAD